MLDIFKEYFVELGLEVSRDKIKNSLQEKQVRERLEDFIQQQSKINFNCSIAEEIDFEALVNYLSGDLINDVRIRLRGTNKEREVAHSTIISKVRKFANAKTKLGEKRAIEITVTSMEILRNYYRSKINSDLLFVTAEITDSLSEIIEKQSDGQINAIKEELTQQSESIVDAISGMVQFSAERVVAEGLNQIQSGEIEQLENLATTYTKVISTSHSLYPHYGYDFKLHNGVQKLTSVPLTYNAEQEFPPQVKCIGTVRLGAKHTEVLTSDVVDYAYRHQLPLVMDVKQAQKWLGTEIDPVQYEAEEWVGKSIPISPKPFKKALPCSVSINSRVEFDYILFRTQEILDDGTIVISNREQRNTPFMFTMKANLETKKLSFTISLNNANNAEVLKYVRFMKSLESGGVISVKSLEHQGDLAKGVLDSFNYESGFGDIDEEINFLEMVVAIENYFDRVVDLPAEIDESQYNVLQYIFKLINGETVIDNWTDIKCRIDLTENMKSDILKWEETPFDLAYVGTVTVTLWEQKYELPIIKRFLQVKPTDLERLKMKADVLDIGDEICLNFIPSDGEQGIKKDSIYRDSIEEFSNDVQLVP